MKSFQQYVSEKTNKSKHKFNSKSELLNLYLKNKISVDEVISLAKDVYGTEVATKSELNGFLKNKFMQDVMADTHNIKASVLVKKIKELLKR